MVLVSPVAPNCSFGHGVCDVQMDGWTDERKEAEKGLHLFVYLFTFFFYFFFGAMQTAHIVSYLCGLSFRMHAFDYRTELKL